MRFIDSLYEIQSTVIRILRIGQTGGLQVFRDFFILGGFPTTVLSTASFVTVRSENPEER